MASKNNTVNKFAKNQAEIHRYVAKTTRSSKLEMLYALQLAFLRNNNPEHWDVQPLPCHYWPAKPSTKPR
jgi:hypothetical protein